MILGNRIGTAAILVAALAAPAGATVITQVEPAYSEANANWTISYAGTGPVTVGLRVAYLDPAMLGSPVILQFTLDGNDLLGGVSRGIQLVNYDNLDDPNVTIRNSTGVAWTDFHILLVNLDPYPFLPHADANFVNPGGVFSNVFGSPASVTYTATSIALDFAGGTVPSGGAVTFSNIMISDNGADGGIFYLKLIPTPEPGTLAVLGLGGVALAFRRRRRLPVR